MATTKITPELLDKCFRFSTEDGEVRYAVASRTSDDEYTVKYDRAHRVITCSCPAGNPPVDIHGFPTYAPRSCWHIAAALEHSKQFKADAARLEKQERLLEMGLTLIEAKEAINHKLIVDGKEADLETLVRVYGPSQSRPTEAEMNRQAKANNPRPFSVLR